MPCRNCSCPNCIDEFDDEYSKYTWISTREEAEDFLETEKDISFIRSLTFKKDCDIDDDYIKRLTNVYNIGYITRLVLNGNKKVTNKSIKYLLDSNDICNRGYQGCHGSLGIPYKELKVFVKDTGVDVGFFYKDDGHLDNYPTNSSLQTTSGSLYRTNFTVSDKGVEYRYCCKFIVLYIESYRSIPNKI